MTFELSYRYSHLDSCKEFGLEIKGNKLYDETYIRRVWFHLGALIGNDKTVHLFPFSWADNIFKGDVVKEYKFCNDAEKQAKLIANKILKQIK